MHWTFTRTPEDLFQEPCEGPILSMSRVHGRLRLSWERFCKILYLKMFTKISQHMQISFTVGEWGRGGGGGTLNNGLRNFKIWYNHCSL
jgi:hypothetical protein